MAKKDKADTASTVEARILCDFWNGERMVLVAERLVSLDHDTVQSYKTAGWVDDHPDAVAYAKALKE